jgi:hypothetical protein
VPQRIFIKLDKCPKHWPFLLFVSLRLLATTQYRPRLGFIEGQFFALGYLAIPILFFTTECLFKRAAAAPAVIFYCFAAAAASFLWPPHREWHITKWQEQQTEREQRLPSVVYI